MYTRVESRHLLFHEPELARLRAVDVPLPEEKIEAARRTRTLVVLRTVISPATLLCLSLMLLFVVVVHVILCRTNERNRGLTCPSTALVIINTWLSRHNDAASIERISNRVAYDAESQLYYAWLVALLDDLL